MSEHPRLPSWYARFPRLERIEIIGVAEQPALGMQKGMVSNIELMVQSIEQAVKEAEMMAACQIVGVFAGITGGHIRSYNSNGVVRHQGR